MVIYLSHQLAGLERVQQGDETWYLDAHGKKITDDETLHRIKSLVIPPAWKNVWISPQADTHLQATGYDTRGRKQYRYHPEWAQLQQHHKFNKMADFGEKLPQVRASVRGHLGDRGLSKQKVLAAIVALLDTTLIRVGNDEYARDNDSYGLTTLRDRHAKIKPHQIVFDFRGKSGVDHEIIIHHPHLVKIIKACQDIPGYELFQYLDDSGHHALHSGDVNEYLHRLTGDHITAKDFRTWGGSMIAAQELRKYEPSQEEKILQHHVITAIKTVAEHLGNRPATSKKYYIHPLILESYLKLQLIKELDTYLDEYRQKPVSGLKAIEFATWKFVEKTNH